MQITNSHPGILSKIASMLIVLVLAVACSTSPTPTPTATPAPVATPRSPTETATLIAEVTEQIVYANVGEMTATLDVYTPSEAGSWPVVVVVHGWGLYKSNFEKLARSIASQGAVVYNINVWFSVPFLPSIERLACAIRFARATAPDYDGDPNRITIVGHSAGAAAGVVVSLAGDDFKGDYCVVSDGSALPDAFVGYEGTYEFTTTNYGDVIDHTNLKQENPELLDAINPYSHIGRNPNLQVRLVHGVDDDYAWYDISPEESIALNQALADSGYAVELISVEGANHGSILYSTSEAFALTVQQVMELARGLSE